jgi:hypothetical protein
MELPVDYTQLTWQERKEAREQYIKEQEGKCMFCGEGLDKEPPKRITKKEINWALFPDNFLKYPVHLQHNHKTGMTEGAVHSYCNAVMWQYKGR